MKRTSKLVLLGFGAGVAVSLAGVRLGTDFLHSRMVENGRIRLSANFSAGSAPAKLPPPPVPGSRVLSDAMRQFENESLRGLDGKRVTLAEIRGKPVFLSLWETTCVPCVLELPAIRKLAVSMRDLPVAFLLVTEEDEASVRRFVASNRDLPVYLADQGKMPETIVALGVPQTFVLDHTGAVVFHYRGPANWDHEDMRAYLRGLIR